MAALALAVLLLAFSGTSSATWCVCKDGSDAILQKTLDYACGAGADCNPLHLNGPCFQPNTVKAHCNYAVNSYFQKKGQVQGSCEFAGTASVTTSDPSTSGCVYPASGSASSTTPVTTTPTMGTTPTTGTPSTSTGTGSTTTGTTGTTPYSTTPGVLGGIGSGMGPSGSGMSNDDSHAGQRLVDSSSLFSVTLFSAFIMFLWG
ncbi:PLASMODESMATA CALLOSE-BINDING PROTEIN 3 [Abrus precatorius]|uniref:PLASMODESMATA CALLOSE-BINDING PROTEIN 3 n=1 Tax=Abrus precatorius TaxID=3816 RepID=A0A8B8JMV2_ABRPR|nr:PLASMODESMATA CALLOSE-BINDING PROTEIN 3 [Abrus precatorius]